MSAKQCDGEECISERSWTVPWRNSHSNELFPLIYSQLSTYYLYLNLPLPWLSPQFLWPDFFSEAQCIRVNVAISMSLKKQNSKHEDGFQGNWAVAIMIVARVEFTSWKQHKNCKKRIRNWTSPFSRDSGSPLAQFSSPTLDYEQKILW